MLVLNDTHLFDALSSLCISATLSDILEFPGTCVTRKLLLILKPCLFEKRVSFLVCDMLLAIGIDLSIGRNLFHHEFFVISCNGPLYARHGRWIEGTRNGRNGELA